MCEYLLVAYTESYDKFLILDMLFDNNISIQHSGETRREQKLYTLGYKTQLSSLEDFK